MAWASRGARECTEGRQLPLLTFPSLHTPVLTHNHYNRCCEETMKVLRASHEFLLTIVEVFIHDPLFKWALSPLRALEIQRNEQEFGEAAEIEVSLSTTTQHNTTPLTFALKGGKFWRQWGGSCGRTGRRGSGFPFGRTGREQGGRESAVALEGKAAGV